MTKHDQCIVNLLRFNSQLLREGNIIARRYGLNQQQFVVLNYIKFNGPINQNQICSSLLLEKSNISKIMKKLEQLKYINISQSSVDKRARIVECSTIGQNIITEGTKQFNALNKILLKELSDDQLNQLHAISMVISNRKT